MRIAYTTVFDATDVHNWSGTPYYMSQELISTPNVWVEYFGNMQRVLPPFFKCADVLKKFFALPRESKRYNLAVAKNYSLQLEKKLHAKQFDYIIAPQVNPIAYLESKIPTILWTDSVYAGLLGFYENTFSHSKQTIIEANALTAECLRRCKLAIFSSAWAANTAIHHYGADRQKIKVVPFGANLTNPPTYAEISQYIKHRDTKTVKLLFLAKSWERKGGDIVVAVAKMLHAAGMKVELDIVGYTPPNADSLPPYIKCRGFISKHTAAGQEKMRALLAASHFLFVPSRAEAYGIVFCEANAFAVPCLTTYIGGISTIIHDGINGMTFACDAPLQHYCDYIANLMQNYASYQELAFAAYNEFVIRLNWKSATTQVLNLLHETT